jgi:NADPH-dependent curcumin reductase CurA
MSNLKSREIRLKSRPNGMPTESNFELAETGVSGPKDGEVLVRNIWMSVDPYMRGRMVDRESYVPPFQIGEPLTGGTIGQVVEAGKNAHFKVGDYLNHMLGWREYAVVGSSAMPQKVDPSIAPVQSFLGALGMPGLTAYAGLFRVGSSNPKIPYSYPPHPVPLGPLFANLPKRAEPTSSALPDQMLNATG